MAQFLSRQTEYFLKIASTGSFREAARLLNISQPALSIAIKKLEEDIGQQLFARDKKNAALTVVGRRLFEALSGFDKTIAVETRKIINADDQPRMRIGSIPWFANLRLFPHLPQQIVKNGQFFIRPAGLIKSAVQSGRLEIGFINWPRKPVGVLSHYIEDDPAVVAGLKSKFPQVELAKSYKDLEDEPWLYGEGRGTDWTQSIPWDKRGFVMSDIYTVKFLVLGGYGIYEIQLAYFSREERKKLAIAKFRTRYADNKIYAIWKPGLSANSKNVLDRLITDLG